MIKNIGAFLCPTVYMYRIPCAVMAMLKNERASVMMCDRQPITLLPHKRSKGKIFGSPLNGHSQSRGTKFYKPIFSAPDVNERIFKYLHRAYNREV